MDRDHLSHQLPPLDYVVETQPDTGIHETIVTLAIMAAAGVSFLIGGLLGRHTPGALFWFALLIALGLVGVCVVALVRDRVRRGA